MLRRIALTFIALTALGLAGCGGEDPRLQKIREAFRHAADTAPAMDITMMAYGPLESFDEAPAPEKLSNVANLQVKGPAFFMSYKGVKDGVTMYEEAMATPDRKTCYFVFGGGKEFNVRSGDQWDITLSVPVPYLFPAWQTPLILSLESDTLELMKDSVEVDGVQCVVVVGTKKNVRPPLQYKLYLDPALGYMPRRTEWLVKGKGLEGTTRLLNYQEVAPGKWFPARIEMEPVPPPTAKRKRLGLCIAEFKLRPDMADGEFILQPAVGANVLDERK